MRLGSVVLVVSAACGNVQSNVHDAPPEPDGEGPPVTAPVTIEVRTAAGDGLPELTASVLVMSDAGAVIFDGLVDGTGKASATITGSHSVTVRFVSDQAMTRTVRMTTIRGVQPNDKLVFGRPRRPDSKTGAAFPRNFSYAPFGAAVSHVFYTPCDNRFIAPGGAQTGTIGVFADCAGATYDFLAIADDKQFVYLPGQQRSATTTINVPLPWTAMNTLTASYTNVPSGMEYFATIRHVLLNDVPVTDIGGNIANPTPGGALSHQLLFPQGVGSGALFDIAFGNQTTGERQILTMSTATPIGSIAFDFATQNLPRLLEIPATTIDGASWVETAVTNEADARLVVWTGSFVTPALTTNIEWTLLDGERAATITLPTLPASYAAYDPRKLPGFTRLDGRFVYYIDCDTITTYAAARPINTMLFYGAKELRPLLGANYRCRRTESPLN